MYVNNFFIYFFNFFNFKFLFMAISSSRLAHEFLGDSFFHVWERSACEFFHIIPFSVVMSFNKTLRKRKHVETNICFFLQHHLVMVEK